MGQFDFTDDPDAAARYAIRTTAMIAGINATRIFPAMMSLRSLHRKMPRATASNEIWNQYFETQHALEDDIIDSLHKVSQLRLNVVAATLPHMIADFYQQPTSTAPGDDPWQPAGREAEKAAVYDAIEILAQVGFHWGNGFANPGLEI